MSDVTPGAVVLEYLRGLRRSQGLEEARKLLRDSTAAPETEKAEGMSEEEAEALRKLAEEEE